MFKFSRVENFPSTHSLILITTIFSIFALASPMMAQNFYPGKDLVFTQVIAANGFDTIIAVSNRGYADYHGDLYFYSGQNGAVWNPVVNGNQVSGGNIPVDIPFGNSRVFRITSASLTVGYAYFYADDLELDNTLEGNLTYYSHNTGTVLDAVGVPASREFFVSSLPFSEFYNVGLSLAVPWEGANRDADVTILLFDEDGNQVSQCQITIPFGGHYAKYLFELPWSTPLTGFGPVGRVELHSDRLLAGIGMTVTAGDQGGAQISTLPLTGTPLFYTLAAEDEDENTYEGEVTFWIEGFYVEGYMVIKRVNEEDNPEPYNWKVTGQLINGEMKLAYPCYLGSTAVTPEVSLFIHFPLYSPSMTEISGTWSADILAWDSAPERGTVTFTQAGGFIKTARVPGSQELKFPSLDPAAPATSGLASVRFIHLVLSLFISFPQCYSGI